jgi:hypothetical protein
MFHPVAFAATPVPRIRVSMGRLSLFQKHLLPNLEHLLFLNQRLLQEFLV